MALVEIRRSWPVFLTACLGIAASFAVYSLARDAARGRLAAELSLEAATQARDLQQVFGRFEGAAAGIAAVFPDPRPTLAQFRAYARNALRGDGGIGAGAQSLGWAPLVRDRDRPALEPAPGGGARRAGMRSESYPLIYIEPEQPNAAPGFDLASDPASATALHRALAEHAAVAGPLTRPGGVPDVVLYVPVRSTDPAPAAAGDAGILVLWVAMPDAVAAAIGGGEPPASGVVLEVLDPAAPAGGQPVYRSAPAAADEALAGEPAPAWRRQASFRFGGRDWTVTARATPPLLAERVAGAGRGELAAGLLLTALLTLYLVTNRAHDARLRRLTERLRREVSARRSTEETLKLTQLGMDHSSEGISLFDRDGNFVNVNEAVCRQLGYTREELLRLTVFDVNPALDRRRWDERWNLPNVDEVPNRHESECRAKDGTRIPVDLTLDHFEVGGAEYVFVVARDASVRRNIEHELRATRDRAESASQAKSQFLANMSHELRTPLNAIIGFSEVISAALFGPLDARYRDYAQDIHGSGRHLLRIINDLLDLSKIEAGRFELHESPVSLAALFANCRRMVAEQAAAGGVTLDLRETPVEVTGDELRLQQVLLNLTSNAVKFTPAGGRVSLEATLAGTGAVSVSVADTGIGMNPDDIPVALQAFGQIDSVLARSHGGTGLGLPLAMRLVELHGGTLSIASAPDRGTTVSFTLPAERTLRPRFHGFARADELPPTGTGN